MNDIWLIGTGLMGIEYAKVLKGLNCEFNVIGRGKANCDNFFLQTGFAAFEGGVENFIETSPPVPAYAIIAAGVDQLKDVTMQLLHFGVKYILLEKPGCGYPSEIAAIAKLANEKDAEILLAYNRRFYSSVLKAKQIITGDGGISSFQFEFTEWSHVIKDLKKTETEHQNWFLGNSTHIIDTAFYLGGKPAEIAAYHKGGISWHTASSIFAGAGISETGALFSYNANWEAPGRWVLELLTKKNRLIFKPMEKLQIQKIGSVTVEPVEIDDTLDITYKPGLYLQTKFFLNKERKEFCTIQDQEKAIQEYYIKMSGYKLQPVNF